MRTSEAAKALTTTSNMTDGAPLQSIHGASTPPVMIGVGGTGETGIRVKTGKQAEKAHQKISLHDMVHHGESASQIMARIAKGDAIGIRNQSSEEVGKIHRRLARIPRYHMVHKNVGHGTVSDLRAIATAIAGTKHYMCAFRRKVFEKEVLVHLQRWSGGTRFRRHLQDNLLAALDISGEDPGMADIAKEVARLSVDANLAHSSLLCYLNYWAHFDNSDQPSVLVVLFDSASCSITGVETLQTGHGSSPQVMAFRRVDGMHLQAYAAAIDLTDISFDGKRETSLDLLQFDPRLSGAKLSHHKCYGGTIDSCFALNKRNVVKGPMRHSSRRPQKSSKPNDGPSRKTSVEGLHTLSIKKSGEPSVKDSEMTLTTTPDHSNAKASDLPAVPLLPQPRGPGEWSFASGKIADMATRRFANVEGFSTQYPPTALAIRNIRRGDPGFAPDLDLIWHPANTVEDPNATSAIDTSQGSISREKARIFLSVRTPEELAGSSLTNLPASENFACGSLGIDLWFRCSNLNSSNGAPIALAVLFVLGLNDYLCRQSNATGRLCHMFQLEPKIPNSKFVFFADRAWSQAEQGQHWAVPPLERLHRSRATAEWHWSSPGTPLLAVALVAVGKDNKFTFPLSSRLYNEGLAGAGPVILLCVPDKVILTNVQRFVTYQGAGTVHGAGRAPQQLSWTLTAEVEERERIAGRCFYGQDVAAAVSTRLSDITRAAYDGKPDAGATLYKWEWVFNELKKGKSQDELSRGSSTFAPSAI